MRTIVGRPVPRGVGLRHRRAKVGASVVLVAAIVAACQMPKPPIPRLPGTGIPGHTAALMVPNRVG